MRGKELLALKNGFILFNTLRSVVIEKGFGNALAAALIIFSLKQALVIRVTWLGKEVLLAFA